ncbi:hypothetical protein GCM10027589_27630 [Actinocorallia lasiicapitis]
MSVPLLGPFRLTARSFASPAGVVYSAFDPAGAPLEVVVLTRGAASDAAARDRFAAAVRDFDGPIVAADTGSTEPWAAGGPGLARTLGPVLLHGRARGPQFLPYWAGVEDPAFPSGRSGPLVVPKGERPRGVIPALVTLLLLAVLLGGMLALLFACQPEDPLRPQEGGGPPSSISATGGSASPSESSSEEGPDGSGSASPNPSSGSGSPNSPRPTQDSGSPKASGGEGGEPDGPNGPETGGPGGDPDGEL